MKKIMKYTLLLVLLVVVTSCFKTEDDQMQSFKEGVVLASVAPISNLLVINNLENSYISFEIDTIEDDFSEIIVNANHRRLNKSGIITTYTTIPEGEIIFTASEIVSKLGMTLDSLESTDEIVFSIAIKSNSGVTASNASSTFTAVIACPMDIAFTFGDYSAFSDPDEWDVSGSVTLTADGIDPYTIYIDGMMDVDGLTSNGNKLAIHLNPATFKITGEATVLADNCGDWDPDYAIYTNYTYTPIDGAYNSCDGSYKILFDISSDLGSFGLYNFEFTRK